MNKISIIKEFDFIIECILNNLSKLKFHPLSISYFLYKNNREKPNLGNLNGRNYAYSLQSKL